MIGRAARIMSALVLTLCIVPASSSGFAQDQPPKPEQNPPKQDAKPPGNTAPGQNPQNPPTAAAKDPTQPAQLDKDVAEITATSIRTEPSPDGDIVHARDVTVALGEYTLTGAFLDGLPQKEMVFSGGATLTFRGQTIVGDTIRFKSQTKEYRIENLRTALTPDFLHGRLTSPLYLHAGDIYGRRKEPIFGDDIEATTCDKLWPDYLIRASQIRVRPGLDIVLKHAAFVLWGKRIITLPTFVIPLNRRIHRSGYTPQFGRSVDEGFFVKSALSYLLADRAPGIFRLDLMEKKGVGTGIEQDWNLLKWGGLLALYAIPSGGNTKNMSGRFNNRFNLGGGETINFDTDFQSNSYLSLPQTTNLNSRFSFNRNVQGYTTGLNLSRQSTESSGSSTSSITANVSQGFQFGRSLTANLNTDYSEYTAQTTSTTSQRTEQLSTRFQADQHANNYSLQLSMNRNVPIGNRAAGSFFGGVEKLPELSLTNYRFTQGFLSKVPANFLLSAGRYSEGGTSGSGSTIVQTDRAVAGFDLTGSRIQLTPRTDLNVAGGFQQFLYTDGFAQYVVRNNTTLTQRFNKRSGINFNYTYQRLEGATPFRFDQQGQFHALNADMGMLDDRHIQLTARVGYDFAHTGFSGFAPMPWQTVSANLLIRPVNWARQRTLFSFDPNTGGFVSATTDWRFRGHNDFGLDLVGRYDPSRHKFGQINTYLNLPVGRLLRAIAILQYNGFLNRFESRNLELIYDLHCMEAVFTYIDNPFGFRNDRQFYFQLRIKALPQASRFGTGQFGQALDTGVGDIF